MEVAGKVALVLGAGKGVGKEIARALAGRGVKVVFTYYDWPEESARTLKEFAAGDFEHLAIRVDLREPSQIAKLVSAAHARFGGIDILINNIERGGMPVVHGPYLEEQWDLEMATTLKAKWWVMHHAMPLLKAAPAGVAVVLSSIAGLVGRSGPASLLFNDAYSAANRAVSSFTETWAREGAPSVRVNELMLGFFETRHAEGTRGWGLLEAAQRQAILDHTLLRRTGQVAEVVEAVLFLIERAGFLTGATLRLDGGYLLGGDLPGPMPAGVL